MTSTGGRVCVRARACVCLCVLVEAAAVPVASRERFWFMAGRSKHRLHCTVSLLLPYYIYRRRTFKPQFYYKIENSSINPRPLSAAVLLRLRTASTTRTKEEDRHRHHPPPHLEKPNVVCKLRLKMCTLRHPRNRRNIYNIILSYNICHMILYICPLVTVYIM